MGSKAGPFVYARSLYIVLTPSPPLSLVLLHILLGYYYIGSIVVGILYTYRFRFDSNDIAFVI